MVLLVGYGAILSVLGAVVVARHRPLHQLRADPQGRVTLGAARLDLVYPRWAEHIRPQALNLRDGQTCLLGQVFGTYSRGLSSLGIAGSGRRHGFVSIGQKDQDALTTLWHAEVLDRQRKAAHVRALAAARLRRQQWASLLAFHEEWEDGYNTEPNYKRRAMRDKVLASA